MDVKNPTPKDLRIFGLLLACVLGVFGGLSARKGGPAAPYLFGAGALSALVSLARSSLMIHVYRPWMRAAGVLAAVNTFLILGILYFFVFTPYAAVMRWLGHDLLDERLRTGESYWKAKERRSPESYERQF